MSSIMVLILTANFFVMSHDMDEGQHTYLLDTVVNNAEYHVAYTGEKLPIDDMKKFLASIKVECEEVQVTNELSLSSVTHFCNAIAISFSVHF